MNKFKYPRTLHLPWSKTITVDDKRFNMRQCFDTFSGKEVVVTEKLDGENTTIYGDCSTHARSLEGAFHESRAWMRGFAPTLGYKLPTGWRVCGESLYAKHSVQYMTLPSYFIAFAIYDENNVCLSWDDFVEMCDKLDVIHAPLLFRGVLSVSDLQKELAPRFSAPAKSAYGPMTEGYVMRLTESYPWSEQSKCLAKYVRANHVQSDSHWMHSRVIKNCLA
jgi:hypothetical protein